VTEIEPVEGTSKRQRLSIEPSGMRLPDHVQAAVRAWAEQQPDKPNLSEAIERLVANGVSD